MSNQRYMMRGVSASKEDVHNAIKNIDKGIFPQAFCKIIPDILGGDPEYCNIMHADGAGTKSSLAYLYWRETGDLSVWKGIAQDALTRTNCWPSCVKWAWASMPRAARRPTWATWCAPSLWTLP